MRLCGPGLAHNECMSLFELGQQLLGHLKPEPEARKGAPHGPRPPTSDAMADLDEIFRTLQQQQNYLAEVSKKIETDIEADRERQQTAQRERERCALHSGAPVPMLDWGPQGRGQEASRDRGAQ